MMAQVFCKAVGDGGGAAGQQQLHAHRATDDIGGANDHRIEAVGVDIVAFQQGHDTARSARTQARRALAQAANVVRMEAVDVFIRRDALENFDVIDPCRQGQLNQNTVDGLIGIQSVDKLQQLGFAGGFREIVRAGDEAHFFTCFALAADINLRGRVAADQHDGQPGARFPAATRAFTFSATSERTCCAIVLPSIIFAAIRERIPSVSLRKGDEDILSEAGLAVSPRLLFYPV